MVLANRSFQSPQLLTRLLLLLGTGFGLLAEQPAFAHPQMTRSVYHRTAINAGPRNVDVTIELTIGEVPALLERLVMDADGDSQIAPDELEAYLNEHTEILQEAVSLTIAGQPVELLFLYEPELDLKGEETSSPFRLVLRLFYFARTPHGLRVGDEIVLSDHLWTHAPAMAFYQVSGQGGIELAAASNTCRRNSLTDKEKSLEMRARFLKVPSVSSSEGGDPQPSSFLTAKLPVRETRSQERPGLISAWTVIIGAIVFIACTISVVARK